MFVGARKKNCGKDARRCGIVWLSIASYGASYEERPEGLHGDLHLSRACSIRCRGLFGRLAKPFAESFGRAHFETRLGMHAKADLPEQCA